MLISQNSLHRKAVVAMRLGEGSVIPTRKHQLFPSLPNCVVKETIGNKMMVFVTHTKKLPKYLKIKKGRHFHDQPLDYSMVPKPGLEPGQAYTH
jgi:hypothetical protein